MMRQDQRWKGACGLLGSLLLAMVWPAACGGKAIVDPDGSGGTGGKGTTTTVTTTVSTSTTTVTTDPPECGQACEILWDCTQVDDYCPGLTPEDKAPFIAECLATCEANPAMLAIIDPNDCQMTVETLEALNPDFAEACSGP